MLHNEADLTQLLLCFVGLSGHPTVLQYCQLEVLKDRRMAAETNEEKEALRNVRLIVQHAESIDTTMAKLNADEEGNLTLGVSYAKALSAYEPVTIEYGFFESFPAGIKYGCHVLAGYVGDLKYIFSSEGAKSLGGFGAIGSLFPATWDWHRFWEMTAFLSIILAFMNILPIPALDGGHVLFLLYEMITRRKPSEDFLIKAEYVGFGLLILLMVVANLNDILRWLGYM